MECQKEFEMTKSQFIYNNSCHSVPTFLDSNMLTSFNPLPHRCWRSTYTQMIFQWGKGVMFPP